MKRLRFSSRRSVNASSYVRLCVVCCALAVFFGFCTVDAQAKMLSFDAFADTENIPSESPSTGSDAGPIEESTPQKPVRNLVLTSLGQMFGLAAGGPASMAAGSSAGSSPPSLFAVIETPRVSSGILVAYLTREEGLLVPVPFMDGVFRPPRRES